MQTENSFDATHSVENLPSSAEVPIEVEEWQLTRLNLMLMLNKEFSEYYIEVAEFLKENRNFNIEEDIGGIDEYPLSIEYVESNIHSTSSYWQYLLSCGGPGSEIRFFVNDKSSIKFNKVEFCLLDWSTVVKHDVTSEDVIEHLWEQILFPFAEPIKTQSELTSLSEETTIGKTQETDPLLALVGTSDIDVTNIKKQFKTSFRPKARVVKGPYEDHPDPLIALLGTLECDVTDIGERHDDYIGDALLAELWGDEDE